MRAIFDKAIFRNRRIFIMSDLLGIIQRQVYKCPACQQFMSTDSDICQKCSFRVPEELKQSAINNQIEEVKEEANKSHRSTVYSGIGLFGLGLFYWLWPFGFLQHFPTVGFGLMISGVITMLFGLRWLWKGK